MRKLIIIFIFLTNIYGMEPILAILHSIDSNEIQEFNIGNYNFYCQPYGVVAVESLHRRSSSNSRCQKSINEFYKKKTNLKYFTNNILYLKQRYHISFKDAKCILYAKGDVSLSELLLKQGLAVLKPLFKDEEFIYRFKISQQQARINKNGIWGTNIRKECISELLKR